MKAMKKDLAGVSPVIAVILMVAITVVLAGVVFLWAQSFTEGSGDTVTTLNVRIKLYEDTTVANQDDKLEIEVLGGTIDWDNYAVKVNGVEYAQTGPLDATPAVITISNAGDTALFVDDMGITKGTAYKVQIVDLDGNKVAYTSENVVALSYAS
ncbi:MAG: type IV pilin [Candidatus Thermoplasmatota archaeon]|nr:type IV pilin [Candidatus Thermoplasmatota archaeon]